MRHRMPGLDGDSEDDDNNNMKEERQGMDIAIFSINDCVYL